MNHHPAHITQFIAQSIVHSSPARSHWWLFSVAIIAHPYCLPIVLQVSCFSLYYPVAMIAHSHHPAVSHYITLLLWLPTPIAHQLYSIYLSLQTLPLSKLAFFPIIHPASFLLTLVPETMPFWPFVLVLLKYEPSLRSIVTIPDFLLGRVLLFW